MSEKYSPWRLPLRVFLLVIIDWALECFLVIAAAFCTNYVLFVTKIDGLLKFDLFLVWRTGFIGIGALSLWILRSFTLSTSTS